MSFNGERLAKKIIGTPTYGWECIVCFQAEAPHCKSKDEARQGGERHAQAARLAAITGGRQMNRATLDKWKPHSRR